MAGPSPECRPASEARRRSPSSSLEHVETPVDSPQTPRPVTHDADPLDDVSFRHSGWARARGQTIQAFGPPLRPDDRPDRFRHCGDNAWLLRSRDNPNTYRIAADFCHDRFCLPCARARGKRIAAILAEWAEGKELKFITLTLRQADVPLGETLDHLLASFRRLRQCKMWKASVTGGVGFVEIKRGAKFDRWNVHIHILANAAFLDYRTLSRMWLKCTGTSFVTDIRPVPDLMHAVHYVTKYASKGIAHTVYGTIELLQEAMAALTGRKLAITFGDARKLHLNDKTDPGDWDNVCTLHTLRRRALAGEQWAQALLDLVTEKFSCPKNPTSPRSPPPPLALFN